MINQFGVYQDLQVTIEEKLHSIILSVEFHPATEHYYIEALTETGFDLCNSSYGYFKSTIRRNTRILLL